MKKLDRPVVKKLEAIVGPDQVTTSVEDCLCYSYDGSGGSFLPAAVVFPDSAHQISAIMELAGSASFPVVPRGAGSGMTGGALPVQGGVVVALSRLNRIVEIDPVNQVAVVEPGVITGDLRDALKEFGLFYPPDPASLKFCTMGGNIAECAGGPSAVKYGVTRDYVRELEVVLADGRIMKTGVPTAKGVAGYDLTRLFIGSEGTLGIITRITVKVIAAPSAIRTFLVACSSMTGAVSLVADLLTRLTPCTLEYLDRTAISIVREKLDLDLSPQVEGLLLIEVDGDEGAVAEQAEILSDFMVSRSDQLVLSFQAAANDEEREKLWTARRAVSPSAFDLRPDKISEDVVVPRSRIAELVAEVEGIAADKNLVVFTFGHAGDGNIHVNIMVDRNDQEEVSRAEMAKDALFTKVLALGGTISGEHGIGITKAPFLRKELGQVEYAVMRQVKDLFDPCGILNPGKIFLGEVR